MTPQFGKYIRALRTEHGMTQAALAAKLHVTDKAVSKWERDLSYPDISLFPRLAEILGVSVSELINAADDGGEPEQLTQIYRVSDEDIRTPIHIIIGCSELVERYAGNPELRKRYLELIRVSARYLLEKCEQRQKASLRNKAEGSKHEGSKPEDIKYAALNTTGSKPAERKEEGRDLPYDFTGKRILIADDMEINREIAGEIIRESGAEAVFCSDGLECLTMIESSPAGFFDLILMDLSMPVMDGIEAARNIRELDDEAKAEIPVIAMTANVTDSDRKAASDVGMNGFAEKPIDTVSLYELLKLNL